MLTTRVQGLEAVPVLVGVDLATREAFGEHLLGRRRRGLLAISGIGRVTDQCEEPEDHEAQNRSMLIDMRA